VLYGCETDLTSQEGTQSGDVCEQRAVNMWIRREK